MKTKSRHDAKTGKAILRPAVASIIAMALLVLVFALASCGGGKTEDPPIVPQNLSQQEIIERLTLPDSSVEVTESGGVAMGSLTEYPDALVFYENRLAELGFANLLSEEQLAQLDGDRQGKTYSGKIGDTPITILIWDWPDTNGNGNMTLVMIAFVPYGGE